jgi:hypothetical protein
MLAIKTKFSRWAAAVSGPLVFMAAPQIFSSLSLSTSSFSSQRSSSTLQKKHKKRV